MIAVILLIPESVQQALDFLNQNIKDYQRHKHVSFQEFLQLLNANPSRILRNIFQSFYDMIKSHVTEIEDDLDRSAIIKYDTGSLFMEGSDVPYFPDMLFANRLMKEMDYLRHGNQQNRISKRQKNRNQVSFEAMAAQLYRFAFKQIAALLPRKKILLVSGSAQLSRIFSEILSFPVQHFPLLMSRCAQSVAVRLK